MEAAHAPAIKINDDHCGSCTVCISLCPYEAISVNEDTGEVALDIEKCQVCGICSSACPASSIEMIYYKMPH